LRLTLTPRLLVALRNIHLGVPVPNADINSLTLFGLITRVGEGGMLIVTPEGIQMMKEMQK
jgi:hypothetical protein